MTEQADQLKRWDEVAQGYQARINRQGKRLEELLKVRNELIVLCEELLGPEWESDPSSYRERLEKLKGL